MRPTRQETDLEFWSNARSYWAKKAEEWFMLSAESNDKEWQQVCWDGEENARQQEFRATLALQEAQGLIVVYSGRPKPRWAQ